MRKSLNILTASSVVLAALATASSPAMAQDQTLTSGSASGAEANSGSISGASSDGNQQGQQQNNWGIGSSNSESNSASGAVSGSESYSGAVSDQAQGQTQGQSTSQTNQQGQMATNQQGVSVENTFNSTPLRRTYVGTNSAVALAASSSFSSDYCGGTASAGASVAPIGVTLGGAKPVFDESCQYLRRSEKFGMAAANYWNMQQPEMAGRLMSLMVWSICMADTRNDTPTPTERACSQMLGSIPNEPPPLQQQTPPVVTPEYVAPNADVAPDQDWDNEPRTPRGELDVIQDPGNPELSYSTTTLQGAAIASVVRP